MPCVSRSHPCLIDVRSASTIPALFAACILAHLMSQHNHTKRRRRRSGARFLVRRNDGRLLQRGHATALVRGGSRRSIRKSSRSSRRLLEDAARGGLAHWLDEPRGNLAFVIVTDQFSRQIHRGSPSAFATDALARAAARDGIERGHDRRFRSTNVRSSICRSNIPNRAWTNTRRLALFTQLVEDTPLEHRAIASESLRFAREHRDIVLRFGRFPHRNACLGRDVDRRGAGISAQREPLRAIASNGLGFVDAVVLHEAAGLRGRARI